MTNARSGVIDVAVFGAGRIGKIGKGQATCRGDRRHGNHDCDNPRHRPRKARLRDQLCLSLPSAAPQLHASSPAGNGTGRGG